MKLKKIIKGTAVAAFTVATLGVGAAFVVNKSLNKNDLSIDTSTNEQAPVNFYKIPAQDAMIAIYASYFSGTDKQGEFKLESRAENTFGMNEALTENFTGKDSPWVMLDSLSDGRNDSNQGSDMNGAHFVTSYHKDTGQVVISMPGMEYDYGPLDTLADAKELITGNIGQTKALKAYAETITEKIQNGEFKDSNGNALQISGEKPIIASHSLGSRPTHIMALDGYKTIILEPRPITNDYVDGLNKLSQDILGYSQTHDEVTSALDENVVSIRAANANIWNSPLMPSTQVHHVPNTYIYGTGNKATFADRHVAGDHAAEVAVPSSMEALSPETSAKKAPKSVSGYRIQKLGQ